MRRFILPHAVLNNICLHCGTGDHWSAAKKDTKDAGGLLADAAVEATNALGETTQRGLEKTQEGLNSAHVQVCTHAHDMLPLARPPSCMNQCRGMQSDQWCLIPVHGHHHDLHQYKRTTLLTTLCDIIYLVWQCDCVVIVIYRGSDGHIFVWIGARRLAGGL